jgi:Sulfatase
MTITTTTTQPGVLVVQKYASPYTNPISMKCCFMYSLLRLVAIIRFVVIALETKPPNILLLLADDLGYGEVDGYSAIPIDIETPYLSRLQEQGLIFTDFYSGEAVCAPARCTLFTGKHTGHATV